MHIQSFKVFSDLAQSASFSKAAEANGITQSAVSQQIRAIEKQFRVKLIERGRKNFSLTPEGRAFLEASQEIMGTLEGLGSRINHLQNVVAGELRIATIFSIGLHELPPCLKTYRRTFSAVEVVVDYRRSSEVYAAVLEGRADVGLVAYPAARRGITAVTFWSDRLVAICAPTHHLAGRRLINMGDLQGEKFVAFEPDLPTRREVDRKFRAAGVKVKLAFEFDNIETVKRAVAVENALSIVPEASILDEVEAGTLKSIEFKNLDMWRPLGALIRRSARVSPPLREFLSLLQGFAPETGSGLRPGVRKVSR